MRLLRLLCCLLLLATMAAGQASSSQATSGAASGPAQQDPNQPPPNPLQEPSKPSEAAANRPKAASWDLGESTSSGQNQDLGEIRLMTRHTEIAGDQTRSFRVGGQNDLAEINFFSDHRFLVTRRVQLLSMFRATDDKSIDPEHNSLQKAYMRIYGPRDEIIVGDALVNYSRLTFNQNIKGVSSSIKVRDNWKVSAVGGVFIDRYGSLYKEMEGRPYLSFVGGGRAEYRFLRDSAIALNVSGTRDMVSFLPSGDPDAAPIPASNRVVSLDTRFQFLGVRLESEYAYSFTDFNLRRPPQSFQGDWGGRLEGSWRHKKLSVRGSYVRFQPNFASMNARQIADLQDIVLRTSYDVTDWLMVDGTMRRSNNDLHGQLTADHQYQTTLWGPEGRVVFHELPFYRRAVFEFGYRHRIVDGTSPFAPATLATANCVPSAAGSTCLDRYVRTPFAEFTIPYKTTYFTIGYERRQSVDLMDASQTSNTNRFYVGLRGIFDLSGWHINPSARLELERQSHRPRIAAATPDYTLDYDTNRLGTAALFVEAPRWFLTELAFRNSGATIFGPVGFRRPSYRAALTYKFMNDENRLLIFSFERNNNFYFNSPNFDERVYGVTMVIKFGKRGR